ncbi:MAG TPA: Smr/MutS family protein [Candidatus Angelobacter sp.]|nr:Smr/MutS family protein [Candidatus Angelobacter sp.]
MSRKPEAIKLVNLEEGMPTVAEARLRVDYEINQARKSGYRAVKLVHGYGSSGTGGALRNELQKDLRQAALNGSIRLFVAGEDWRVSNEITWELLKQFPEWKQDCDLGRGNQGISIVVIR